MREAGCPIGITILGGSDTPIGILLVSNLQKESAAGKSNQVRPGDQLLEVNKHNLEGKKNVNFMNSFNNGNIMTSSLFYFDSLFIIHLTSC